MHVAKKRAEFRASVINISFVAGAAVFSKSKEDFIFCDALSQNKHLMAALLYLC